MAEVIDVAARPALPPGAPHALLAEALDVSAYERIDLAFLLASAPTPRSGRTLVLCWGHRWRRVRCVAVALALASRRALRFPCAFLMRPRARSTLPLPSRSRRHARADPAASPTARPSTRPLPHPLPDGASDPPEATRRPRRRRPAAASTYPMAPSTAPSGHVGVSPLPAARFRLPPPCAPPVRLRR